MSSRPASDAAYPPRELLDPDGEGIYLHEDGYGILLRASWLFFGRWDRWSEIDQETVYMRPGDGDEWVPAKIGRHPRGWKLNLPKRLFPVEVYVYCTPQPGSM